MSNKERIIELLDSVPDYKIGYVLAYVQGIVAGEEANDFYVSAWLKTMKIIPITNTKNSSKGYCLQQRYP